MEIYYVITTTAIESHNWDWHVSKMTMPHGARYVAYVHIGDRIAVQAIEDSPQRALNQAYKNALERQYIKNLETHEVLEIGI